MAAMEDIRARKLQPIYHALESGNWRQAVRLSEKRDVEKWLTTKALKANGLWRLGRFDESLRLCLEVQAATPTDEDTLAAMSYNYRIMNRRENLAPMFEAAVKAKPEDVALLKELFMTYVRAKEYLKAQQTATKLHRLSSKSGKFIIWAAASMLLQAQRKDASAGVTTLPLAEKMTLKVLEAQAANGSPPVGEELLLFVDILKLQGKDRKAIEALDLFKPKPNAPVEGRQEAAVETIEDESSLEGGTIVHMQELDRLELKAELHQKLGGSDDLERAQEIVVQELLRRCPDQWSYYSSFLDLVEKRSGLGGDHQGQRGSEHQWPAAVIDALDVIRRLQEDNPKLRGPFLAEMEVIKRAIAWFGCDSTVPPQPTEPAEGNANAQENGVEAMVGEGLLWGQLCRCIDRYMQMFSAKLCCFRDMRPYLALFAVESTELREGLSWLREFFRKEAAESKVEEEHRETAQDAPLDSEQREIGVKRLHRYICACQSRHLLGDYTASTKEKPSSGEEAEASPNGLASVNHNSSSSKGLEQDYRKVVLELTQQYRATLDLNLESEGGEREVKHGDDLVVLAARIVLRLCSLYEKEGHAEKGYLARVEATCLLEGAISCSPYNHHLKILAMDVYRQLGSFARGLTLFGQLDVKQIQLDTLSYLMLEPSGDHGLFGEVQGQCRGIRAVHRNCRNETADHVARAFDRGNYSKGSEVDRFQEERLDRSLQLALAKAEKVTMDLILDHQTFVSAARFLQEEALSDDGREAGGTVFPGDTWLEGLRENMDYSVEEDRCRAVRGSEAAALDETRSRRVKASLKRLLLANQTFTLALKGEPPAHVDSKARELEASVAEAELQASAGDESSGVSSEIEGLTSSLAALSATGTTTGSDGGDPVVNCSLPWKILVAAARALAFAHKHGAASGGGGGGGAGSGEGDPKALEKAARAMMAGAECAKAYRGMLAACPRHLCSLESGEGGEKTYQAEAPLRPQWLRLVSRAMTDGVIYTCILLQAIGAELPQDKKKKGSKSKGKGKGKKPSASASATSGAGGSGASGGSPLSAALVRAHEALSALGWEVSEVLRAMSTPLKSELSAKLEPARPGQTLSRLLRGELGPRYEPAVGVLWERKEDEPSGSRAPWCKEDVISAAVIGVTAGQALCCQRLLSVVTENLSLLQRWEKK